MADPEPRTYDPALLSPIEADDLDKCRTWVRFFTKDRPDYRGNWTERSYLDAELNAQLELDSVQDDSVDPFVIYYRPHITAVKLVKGDPERFTYVNLDGYSKSFVDPEKAMLVWLDDGKKFDAQIPVELLPSVSAYDHFSTVMGQIAR